MFLQSDDCKLRILKDKKGSGRGIFKVAHPISLWGLQVKLFAAETRGNRRAKFSHFGRWRTRVLQPLELNKESGCAPEPTAD